MHGHREKEKKRIICGTWAFASDYWTAQTGKDSLAVLRAAVKYGISSFDCAVSYGRGRSEQILGQFLKRQDGSFRIATKDLPGETARMAKNLDKSLSRLFRKSIDLYYIHWPVPGTDWPAVCSWLDEEKTAGRILRIGLSNVNEADLKRISELTRISDVQNGFNLLYSRDRAGLIPSCRAAGISYSSYSPLAQGLLSGKYDSVAQLAPDDRRKNLVFFKPDVYPAFQEAIRGLKDLSRESGFSLARIALCWVLNQEGVDSAVVGCRNARQAEELFVLTEESVPGDVLDQAEKICEETNKLASRYPNIFDHVFKVRGPEPRPER